MIQETFNIIIEDHLTRYLSSKVHPLPADGKWVFPCNVSEIGDATAGVPKGKVIMSLVSIEEDRVFNVNENAIRRTGVLNAAAQKPPVYLNLNVLFAANFDSANYLTGLNVISFIVRFFQHQNVFTPTNSPRLGNPDVDIEALIFELRTLSFQDLNNMWGVLGSKYMPSVLYKVRMVPIRENLDEGDVSFIRRVTIDENPIR